MRPSIALVATLLCGCGASRPLLPDLALEVRNEQTRFALPKGDTRVRTGVTVALGLRLPLGGAPGAAFVEDAGWSSNLRAAPCLSPRLCRWERSMRARVLRRLERAERSPE